MIKKKMLFVNFLNSEWSREHRKPHIRAFSKDFKVICILPPINLLNFFKIKLLKKTLEEKILFYRPIMLVPYALSYRYKYLSKINNLLLTLSLKKRIFKKFKNYKIVTVLSCPQHECAIDVLDKSILCYECYDAYSKYPGIKSYLRKILERKEEWLIKKSSIIFTSSYNLFLQKKDLHEKTFFIPNSAEIDLFCKGDFSNPPEDIRNIPGNKVGLIGNINDLVDIELLLFLSDKLPWVSFVFIGHVNGGKKFKKNRRFLQLKDKKNVYFLGFRQYELLPNYLHALDVCMLPYKLIEYTDFVLPNKTFQFFAQNKSIVATNLKELKPYNEIIDLAKTYEEFACFIERNLKKCLSNEKIKKMVTIAKKNSTVNAAKRKVAIINSLF